MSLKKFSEVLMKTLFRSRMSEIREEINRERAQRTAMYRDEYNMHKKPSINGLHVRFDTTWYRRLVAMGLTE